VAGPIGGYPSTHSMGSMHGTFEEVTEPLLDVVLLVAAVTLALALAVIALGSAINAVRVRRGRETLFVGRWGDFGPELYLVGRVAVRRLHEPQDHDRPALAFARQMLAEVMSVRPEARLARAFAEARLEPLSFDGFVLSKSDVAAWLEGQARPRSSVT
jgi:hypothetical protein